MQSSDDNTLAHAAYSLGNDLAHLLQRMSYLWSDREYLLSRKVPLDRDPPEFESVAEAIRMLVRTAGTSSEGSYALLRAATNSRRGWLEAWLLYEQRATPQEIGPAAGDCFGPAWHDLRLLRRLVEQQLQDRLALAWWRLGEALAEDELQVPRSRSICVVLNELIASGAAFLRPLRSLTECQPGDAPESADALSDIVLGRPTPKSVDRYIRTHLRQGFGRECLLSFGDECFVFCGERYRAAEVPSASYRLLSVFAEHPQQRLTTHELARLGNCRRRLPPGAPVSFNSVDLKVPISKLRKLLFPAVEAMFGADVPEHGRDSFIVTHWQRKGVPGTYELVLSPKQVVVVRALATGE